MTAQRPSHEHLVRSGATGVLRWVVTLAWAYAAISIATVVAIILMRDDASVVNAAVWIRGSIVAATSLLLLAYAVQAVRGNPRGLLRVRIISTILLVAIVAILIIPLPFPLWMKVEQSVCGLILLVMVIQANRRGLVSAFRADTVTRAD